MHLINFKILPKVTVLNRFYNLEKKTKIINTSTFASNTSRPLNKLNTVEYYRLLICISLTSPVTIKYITNCSNF